MKNFSSNKKTDSKSTLNERFKNSAVAVRDYSEILIESLDYVLESKGRLEQGLVRSLPSPRIAVSIQGSEDDYKNSIRENNPFPHGDSFIATGIFSLLVWCALFLFGADWGGIKSPPFTVFLLLLFIITAIRGSAFIFALVSHYAFILFNRYRAKRNFYIYEKVLYPKDLGICDIRNNLNSRFYSGAPNLYMNENIVKNKYDREKINVLFESTYKVTENIEKEQEVPYLDSNHNYIAPNIESYLYFRDYLETLAKEVLGHYSALVTEERIDFLIAKNNLDEIFARHSEALKSYIKNETSSERKKRSGINTNDETKESPIEDLDSFFSKK